jgi:hypothetical protein
VASARQKDAARRNIAKAHDAQSASASGMKTRRTSDLSTAEKGRLSDKDFAFPKERKEPLVDARHVRNAVARFDQVEGVSDKERDQSWNRIKRAAKRFDVELKAGDWRELSAGGKAKKKRGD